MNERDMPQSLSYRAELLRRVMPALRAGECCSLIGVSGVGKTNLVRFLQRNDVQSEYWGDDCAWVILIDTNGLAFGAHSEEFAVLESMIHQLIHEAERRRMPADVIADFDRLHAGLIALPDAHLSLRYLDRICGRLCEEFGLRIVFAFDQFEDIWKNLDARLFLNLRHLRDEYKYKLTYLVLTREQLQRIRQRSRDDLIAVESFWELFTSHVYGLGMYGANDAATAIERIARRRDIKVSDTLRRTVIDASGGHPALLRALFWILHDHQSATAQATELLQAAKISEECAKIWNDLLPEEQHLARLLASDLAIGDADAALLADLRMKEIVVGEPTRLFSPIFSAYVRQQDGIDVSGIIIDPSFRQVWLNGRPLAEPLSPLEFNLLEYLARNAGKVCRREDILRALYHDSALDANDERLDTVLRRLREALGEDARNPRYLFTHRGVGVRLVQGRVQE
jgi:DNA-binding winged helix-turn-helix (wHTH) protein